MLLSSCVRALFKMQKTIWDSKKSESLQNDFECEEMVLSKELMMCDESISYESKKRQRSNMDDAKEKEERETKKRE